MFDVVMVMHHVYYNGTCLVRHNSLRSLLPNSLSISALRDSLSKCSMLSNSRLKLFKIPFSISAMCVYTSLMGLRNSE